MSQEIINIGPQPNDGQGDNLRTAFDKTNENFDQIWAAGPVGSNVQISGNTISTLQVNQDLALSPNGVGNVRLNNNTIPGANNTWFLGSVTNVWRGVYANTITVGTANISNANITGGAITIGIANLHISGGTNGYVLQTDGAGNLTWTAQTGGSGNATPGGANTQIQYNNAGVLGGSAGFTFNNVSNVFTVPGNILPAGNNTQNLGSATSQWNDLYLSNATIYMNSVPISLTAGNVLTVNGADVVTTDANGQTNIGNLDITGTYVSIASGADETIITISPNIEGQAYLQIPNDATSNVANVRLHNDAGNIELSTGAGSHNWYFDKDGKLTAPGEVYGQYFSLRGGEASGTIGSLGYGGNIIDLYGTNGVTISTVTEGGPQWQFGDDGNLTLPDGSYIFDGKMYGNSEDGGTIGNATGIVQVYARNNGVGIQTYDTPNLNYHTWTFSMDGNIYLPDGDGISINYANGQPYGGTSYGNSNVAAYLPTYTGSIGASNIAFTNDYVYTGNTFVSPETNGILKNFQWKFSDTATGADTVTLQWNLLDTTFPQWYLTTNSQSNVYVFDGDAKSIGFSNSGINSGTVTFGTAADNGAGGSNDIELTAVTGNAYVRTGSNSWKFDNTGNLSVPVNINFNGGGLQQVVNEDFYVRVSDDESDGWSLLNVVDDGAGNDLTQTRLEYNQFSVRTNIQGATSHTWQFNDSGTLGLPGNIAGNYGGNLFVSIGDQPGSDTFIDLRTISYVGDALISNIRIANPNVTVSTSSGVHNWTFDSSGNLNLPPSGNLVGSTPNNNGYLSWFGNSSGDNNGYTTLRLVPDDTRESADQYLIIDPTAPGHIHIRAGGTQDNSGADLILGGENSHFKVNAGANNEVQIRANSYAWTFGADSVLTVPNEGVIRSIQDTVVLQSYDINGNTYSARLGTTGGMYFETTEYPSGWLSLTNESGNANIAAGAAASGQGGRDLYINAGASDSITWNSNSGGNVEIYGGYGSFADGGGGPGGDVSIYGGFSSDSHPGNVYIQGPNYWTFDYTGNLTIPGSIIVGVTASPAPSLDGFGVINTGNVGVSNVIFSDDTVQTTAFVGSASNIASGNTSITIDSLGGNIAFNVSGTTYGQIGPGVALGYGAGNGLGNANNAIQVSGIAIGTQAGQTSQGTHGIAIGWRTGENLQGAHALAIGENAAFVSQGNNAIALGYVAARSSQGVDAIAIGRAAAFTSQSANAVAIGQNAGYSSQGQNAVAIGTLAGNAGQGGSAVAVGSGAGTLSQGVNSVAVGTGAGEQSQGAGSTALGFVAGQINQGGFAVAVGVGAAYDSQGIGAIAVGADASPIQQGDYSIAIGAGASLNSLQPDNSIIIDAGNIQLGATGAGLFINPVRNDVGNVGNVVTYNTTTKEFTYANTISVAGTVSGLTLASTQSAPNEGGEIQLALPSSGTSLTGNIIIDSYQNWIRFFESSDSRGLYVDVPNVSVSGQYAIGYRDVPQITLSGNITANSIAAGKHFYSTTAGNLQVTIPDNANVAFPTGATLTIVMNAAGNVIVAQGTGVSLYMAGSSTTGNRTVGAYGLASVMKVATNTWVISGTGVY